MIFKSLKKVLHGPETALLFCSRRKDYLTATNIGSPPGAGDEEVGSAACGDAQDRSGSLSAPSGMTCQPGELSPSQGTLIEPKWQGRTDALWALSDSPTF